MIEARAINKSYGSLQAVQDLSFKTEPGRVFGIIGPNGAGKSTTIRMLMNIISPDSGEILIEDKPFSEEDKDRIGYLPEERGLYKKVKVGEALLYCAALKGKKRREAEPEIDRWLERFDLQDWKNRKIEELSKGMAQKVQFISAVVHKPDLIFFDEPFAGLDPVSSETLINALMDLKNEGRCILFSTHIMEHAEKICSDILLINKGQSVVQGPLNKIKQSFGKNSVIIEFEGNADFIDSLDCVDSVSRFPHYLEVDIKKGHSHDELLQKLGGTLSVSRFELINPSLHTIFIKLVGGETK